MKITIEIVPNRFTRFLGARAMNLRNGVHIAGHYLHSKLIIAKNGVRQGLSKPITN